MKMCGRDARERGDRECGEGVEQPSQSVPCSRRRTSGASPHSVGVYSHAFYSHALLRLVFCVFLVVFAMPSYAQTAALPIVTGPPDVLVIVYQLPDGSDQVDVTYSKIVPHAQAVQDCAALTQAGGWPISPQSIRDAAAPMSRYVRPMTSIAFQALGIVQDTAHTLPIEAFARAFHKYKRLNVVFFVDPQFQFQGARSYADTSIKMRLDQQGTAYTYAVEILDPNSASLPSLTSGAPSSAAHKSPWPVIWGILGVAALAGLVVYLIAARFTPKPEPAGDSASERLKVGTKG